MPHTNNEFLQRLEAAFPGGSNGSWYIYAALVCQANDRMDFIGDIWGHVRSQSPDTEEQLVKARKLREALLKASVLVGFPKGINACTTFRNVLLAEDPVLAEKLDRDPSLRQHLERSEKDARGLAFFTKIYAQHTDRVLQNMSLASGGDLAEFAIDAVYGDLMAEESRLSAKETGLLEFLACYATGGSAWAQAKGHMYGSHNLGNSRADIVGAIDIAKKIEQKFDIQINREPAENWAWISKSDKW